MRWYDLDINKIPELMKSTLRRVGSVDDDKRAAALAHVEASIGLW
jgi:hypothetical protein